MLHSTPAKPDHATRKLKVLTQDQVLISISTILSTAQSRWLAVQLIKMIEASRKNKVLS